MAACNGGCSISISVEKSEKFKLISNGYKWKIAAQSSKIVGSNLDDITNPFGEDKEFIEDKFSDFIKYQEHPL